MYDKETNYMETTELIMPVKQTTGEKGQTYLTEDNITSIKEVFRNKESYNFYMRTLWVLREIAEKSCMVDTCRGMDINEEDPAYPIWKTMNELIGCFFVGSSRDFLSPNN